MPQELHAQEPPPVEQGQAPAFDNSYARLPDRFFARIEPKPVSAPKLLKLNRPLALELGLDPEWLESPAGVAMIAGNDFPETARPIALAYAGHQFGGFVPSLGDGRALLVGEVIDDRGRRRDIHLKGSGATRFSRAADGRSPLGPVLREYIVSEAMTALGIPSSRTLAAVATGDTVYRQTRQPGAVLARVAASHIRIGTFQYFAARGDIDGLRTLADHVLARHYPDMAARPGRTLGLLEAVIAAQADLIARWMLVGFIHGVMNTDNMTVSGETIDYGPCAFMDAYDPATVFSSIDANGRYAYANQPRIAVWNLARLAEAMLPLFSDNDGEAVALAENALKGFQPRYEKAFHAGLRRKAGLLTERPDDLPLIAELFDLMAANRADFTLTFRSLAQEIDAAATAGTARALFDDSAAFDSWAVKWRERLALEPGLDEERASVMRSANPKYIARNHRVEEAIAAAVERSDFQPFEALVAVLTKPYDDQPGKERYAEAPRQEERVLQTFCGT